MNLSLTSKQIIDSNANWSEIDSRKTPTWFKDAKFGIFVHWGPYSVPAYKTVNNRLFGSYAEWYYSTVYGNYGNDIDDFHKRVYGDIDYHKMAEQFKAELFDANEFARIIKDSRAKYVIITSKHHDGFCMWNTENEHKKNWNSMAIGPKRDIISELRSAILEQDIKFGLYYSIIDWESVPSERCNGGYFIPKKDVIRYGIGKQKYLREILLPQMYEIVNQFKPSVFVADGGEWDLTAEEVDICNYLTWLYNESPVKNEIVVNDRFFKGMPGNHGDYYSTEYQDKVIGSSHLFEESRAVGKSYGYNSLEKLNDYLSSQELIDHLYKNVCRGGNFLLNVGPKADGTIPLIQVERLMAIGKWLDSCGEAIFNTTVLDKWIYATQNDTYEYYFYVPAEINKDPFSLEEALVGVLGKHVDILAVEDNCTIKDNKLHISNYYKYFQQLNEFGVLVLRQKRGR